MWFKILLQVIKLIVRIYPFAFLIASASVMGWHVSVDADNDEVTKITLYKE